MKLVLASASPRREELLRRIAPEFDIVPSRIEEPKSGRPAWRALEAARRKARAVATHTDGLIIAADTLVVLRSHVLGKPGTAADAAEMLRRLSGRSHRVITALCLIETQRGSERAAVERTRVHFRPLSESDIARYLESGEYEGKAGAYGIQGRAATFVDWIRGDYTNVMGLPVSRLTLLLRELGLDV